MANLVKSGARSVEKYEPVELECGVSVEFQKVSDGDNREIRGEAKKDGKEMGRISFITSSGHFFMNVNMELLGAADAKAVADCLYDGFKELAE